MGCTQAIVLFDGVCNLCDASVRFIADRDPRGRFHFAALQSAVGERLLAERGLEPGQVEGVVLIEGDSVHQRSDAALRIAARLSGAWPLLSLLRVLPRFLRNGVYDRIASRRYRWFGRRDECTIPTRELRRRFLHD
jgi:predicted DCC family thiol-disulfide oxidoreductase YuxK